MRTPRGSIGLLLLPALLASLPAPAAPSAAKDSSLSVARWVVLGPVAHPLPLFGEEGRSRYDLANLLEAEPLSLAALEPTTGASLRWVSGETLRWSERDAGKGTVSLARGGEPALALLASYVSAQRYASVELTVLGSHPRRAWLDGAPVAQGGLEEPAECTGTLLLAPGRHLLVIETVLDPERKEAWSAGARLSWKAEAARPELQLSTRPERVVELRDILDPPRITALALAPSGRELALSVTRILPGTHDEESWIEIVETSTGDRPEVWRGGSGMRQVAWSPDGQYFSYVADSPLTADKDDPPGKKSTLYLKERASQKITPLLEGVSRLEGYRWSPDGRAIVYWTTTAAEADERGIKRLEGLMDRWATFRDKHYLHLVTVPDGLRRQLTAGALSAQARAFSPDGSKLLFTRQVEDLVARPYFRIELWEIALDGSKGTKLRDFRWLTDASYSPDGSRLLITGGAAEFDGVGLVLPEGMIPNANDGQLFIWDPASGTVDPITREFDPAVLRARWCRRDGQIYLTAADRDYERLFRYDPASRSFTTIATGVDVFEELTLAERGLVAAGLGTSPWEPPQLVVVDLATGSSRRLEHPARGWLDHVQRGTVEPWAFQSASGKRIEGRFYLPPGFDSERRYPLIVNYYGGTTPVSRRFGGRYPLEWWASRGYVVYVPQPSGAIGYGQAFSALHVNDWGKSTTREIAEGTRQFLEAHPWVDRARVGCLGASYGGFITMLLSARDDLYAAAVAHAGISSIASYWGEGYWGYSYSAVATAESFPWNRHDIYIEQSPLFHADQVRVPILLTHGASDPNVPVGQSDAFYVALKLLGRTVEYVQVAEQEHWILDHRKRQAWASSIVAWFDRWLKGEPEWWEALYPSPDGD
jgi:dipeptidyl aminopeptidase/acylaminoacyl peptidase